MEQENIFEWHFTVRGPSETDYEDGFYHGRILLPNDYPMKPPSIIMLTPNGRFEVRKKICLSISGYHPETWQPCWSIRTVLLAIIAFMPTKSDGSIGSIMYSEEEKKKLAKKSHLWKCPECGLIKNLLKSENSNERVEDGAPAMQQSDYDFLKNVSFKGENESTKPEANATQSPPSSDASNERLNDQVSGSPNAPVETIDEPSVAPGVPLNENNASNNDANADHPGAQEIVRTATRSTFRSIFSLNKPTIDLMISGIVAIISTLVARRVVSFVGANLRDFDF